MEGFPGLFAITHSDIELKRLFFFFCLLQMLSGHGTRTSVFTTARGGLNISFSRFLRHQVCDDVLGRSGISHTGR